MFRRRSDNGLVTQIVLLLVLALVSGVLASGLVLPFAGGLGLAARATTQKFDDLPTDLKIPPLPQRSYMYAADGKTVLATFFDEDRTNISLARVNEKMRTAVVDIEDSRFYSHGGTDLKALLRAAVNNQQGNDQQGGSTLTMQYVRNVLKQSATTPQELKEATAPTTARKLREVRYAIALEQKFTKDQILERYLNVAYFGAGAHGVQAAANRYFGVQASELTLVQAATLAGIIQQPVRFDPFIKGQAKLTVDRRDVVLNRMHELGHISDQELADAKATKLDLSRARVARNGCEATYQKVAVWFCDYVRAIFRSDPYGEHTFGDTVEERDNLLLEGGLKIRTTLDMTMQQDVQDGLDKWVDKPNKVAGVVTMVEPGTGQVKALALSKDYGDKLPDNTATKVNLALSRALGGSGGTQAGSTFKAFVLAAALKSGDYGVNYSMNAPPRLDDVKQMDACPATGKDKVDARWATKNETSTEGGTFTMKTAFAQSINTWWVQMEEKTGVCEPATLAAAMGLKQADTLQPLVQVPSFTLGVNSVAPLDMAAAYATFAARGTFCRPIAITSVTQRTNGKDVKIKIPSAKCRNVLPPDVADAVNNVAQATVTQGSGRRAAIGRQLAGKTGTTQDRQDAWFIGYTPNMVGTVTIWNPDPGSYPLFDRTIGGNFYPRIQGANLPAPLWHDSVGKAILDSSLEAADFFKMNPEYYKGGSDSKSYRRSCRCSYEDKLEGAAGDRYFDSVDRARRNGGEAGGYSGSYGDGRYGGRKGTKTPTPSPTGGTGTTGPAGTTTGPTSTDKGKGGKH